MKFSCILSITIFSILGHAESFNKEVLKNDSCLNPQVVEDVLRDFQVTDPSSETDVPLCDINNIKTKAIHALAMVKYGRFRFPTNLDSIYEATFTPTKTPYQFLTKRVNKVEITNLHCQDSTVAYVFGGGWEKKFYLCRDRAEISASMIASAAIHESRHLDHDDEGHVLCEQGERKGLEGGCDKSLEQRGAYFYGLEYDILVSKYGVNFHPALRGLSRGYAIWTILNKFNEVPRIESLPYSTAVTESNEVIFISPNSMSDPISVKTSAPVMTVGDNTFIYRNEKNKSVIYDRYLGPRQAQREHIFDIVNYDFKDVQYVEGKTTVLEAGLGEELITLQKAQYSNGLKIRSFTEKLSFRDAERFVSRSQCTKPKDSAVYIATRGGLVYEASFEDNRIAFRQTQACDLRLLDSVQVGKRKFRVHLTGELEVKKLLGWRKIPEYQHLRFKSVTAPADFYDAFRTPHH